MKTKINLLLALALAVATSHAQQDPPKEPVKPRPTLAPEARKEAPPAEKPAPETRRETPPVKPRSERPDEPKRRPEQPGHRDEVGKPKPPAREEKPTPFIGIAMEPVPPPLRAHFGIDEGFGVMVGMVLEDSPAAKAGIRQHDLILKVDDQRIVNMEQLKALISSGKKGDVVKLTVISKGSEKVVGVTLDEKMMPAPSHEHGHHPFLEGPMAERMREWGRDHPRGEGMMRPDASREWREKMEQFQERMRDFQEAMKRWHEGDRRGPMPQPPMMHPPQGDRPGAREPQREGHRPPEARDRREPPPEFRRPPSESPRDGDRERAETRSRESTSTHASSATISRRDESGEYVLSRHGRGAVFTVRPNRGETQSWDLSNKEARESIPPQFREKLEMLEGIRVDAR